MNMNQQQSPPALPLYERVEQLRLEQGWTRVKLAQSANVSRGTIDSWKTQPRPPLAPTVVAVADRLGIDRDEALRLAGIKRPAEIADSATGEAGRRHLQSIEGGNEPLPPQDFGLGDEPPFPGKTHNAHGLNTPEILNEVWAMAKELEARLNEERGPQRDRKQRAIEQYKLAAQTLAAELNDAG
jgi:transcriptional regulator with XRE-family HTH domain